MLLFKKHLFQSDLYLNCKISENGNGKSKEIRQDKKNYPDCDDHIQENRVPAHMER